jgi:hypothetical protein
MAGGRAPTECKGLCDVGRSERGSGAPKSALFSHCRTSLMEGRNERKKSELSGNGSKE